MPNDLIAVTIRAAHPLNREAGDGYAHDLGSIRIDNGR